MREVWIRLRALATRRRIAAAVFLAASIVAILQGPDLVRATVSHPYFAVANMEFAEAHLGPRAASVVGHARTSPEELVDWVGFVPGTSVFSIRPRALARRLEQHPWVLRASVQVQPPRLLAVRVVQRRPIAIARIDGRYFQVDRRGVLVAPMAANDSPDLPIISGLDDAFGRTAARVALPRVAFLLRHYEGSPDFGKISEIALDPAHGATLISGSKRMAVKLGWDGWSAKLARGERVLAARVGAVAPVAVLDLRDRAAVVVREYPPRPIVPGGDPGRRGAGQKGTAV